ncbi:Poly(A)-specific ribonuclease [Ascochyta rabiei]|uniref:Nucleic acid binding n=1 Tax=Didymella rabiei TaxID=5454 RepID=A0A163ALZ2_DIDRA|nr:Poly(A)-specific ribonuclease [Ascochyta rabiei]KZM21260.1 nucleic acid binding [Ascochyta rabiei]UPX21300.1 Poly(A)-specific ribonuclease [Ascochyta rabiei]
MEVDAPSFPHHLLALLIHISEADFVSFDLELSGIPSHLPSKKPRAGRLTLEDRYAETKEGADRYQILQVGLTCAKFDYVANQYVLRPFNINLSPLLDERLDFEREISFQSGACTFLLGCGFDLGAPFAKGVQYLSREEAVRAKRLAYDRIDKKNPISDLQLKDTDTESLDFVRRCRDAITAWQKTTSSSLEITSSTGSPIAASTFTISRFEKRLVHQLVRAEFPNAVAIGRNDCIRILPFDAEREADNTRRIKSRVKEQIARQTGFRWIFEALVGGEVNPDLLYITRGSAGVDGRDRFDRALARLKTKQPVLVGHNMFTDVVYLYRTFVGPLPDTLAGFNDALHELFPKIIDTKYLATHAEGDLNASPTLEEIAKGLQDQPLPSIVTHEEHGKYNDMEAFHEAGYDSLLTATIMLRLAAKLGSERKTDEPRPPLQREASEGGIRLPTPADDFIIDGREKIQHPVRVPPTSATNGKKKRSKSKKAAATTKFETKNLFDNLKALSMDDQTSSSDEEAEPTANGHWADEVFVQDKTGWVPVKKMTRQKLELIPPFDDAFWATFGNKLRVFGTEEREMRIAGWPKRV